MRLASRVRSLQRRIKEPWSYDNATPEQLAALDAMIDGIFGDEPDPPGSGPHPPGTRFFAFRDAVNKPFNGQQPPPPDTFSLHPPANLLYRLRLLPPHILAFHG
ncbi:MAG: hypothetical protein AB7U18_12435 [Dehalococcoidia bacterium]